MDESFAKGSIKASYSKHEQASSSEQPDLSVLQTPVSMSNEKFAMSPPMKQGSTPLNVLGQKLSSAGIAKSLTGIPGKGYSQSITP